ncbi:methyl-accepting chemotaxis protein [Laspinema olomoucense]|uniref:Methyl-accepting chemotaxis protein n=1 Tax=Laspinema olomoucense D3b TaxID=2953688 RepID=A0ABT2NH74_9CYAN|nr:MULTISPECIES: methyl-accepting chemotaxis protein [unclassified Laspinema]MCT7974406.1 methyl-accepting chemotaxis protein [Laspinema sp. D3d]MCT7981239.1 methyl-accepting chemotaxis protein [Laspinema sp. D3b]MCT7991685.1 methyl-accepting chemotaxis protein [Laspinema sp. D3a]
MLNPLKLKTRILLGYSVPLLLSLGFAAVVSCQTQTLQQKLDTDAAGQQILDNSERMVSGLSQMQRYSASFLVNPEVDFLIEYEKKSQLFEDSLEFLDLQLENPDLQIRLDRIKELGNQIDSLNRYLMTLTQTQKRDQAIRAFAAAESHNLSLEITQALDDFLAVQNQLQLSKGEGTHIAIMALKEWVWVGSGVLVLFTLAISTAWTYRIVEAIAHPLLSLQSTAKEITHNILVSETLLSHQAEGLSQTSAVLESLTQSAGLHAQETESTQVQVAQIEDKMLSLRGHLGKIYGLTHRVTDLATQTNLLALHAGVESQRPGLECHCLDAVATKMRTLATETQKSAKQVNTLVTQLEIEPHSVPMELEEPEQNVEPIWSAIGELATQTRAISKTSQQQATAIQQVFEALDSPYHTARETVQTLSETKIRLQQLNRDAHQLFELL